MSYRLDIPYPEAEAIVSEPIATTWCVDGMSARCVPYGPDDPVRRLYASAGLPFEERCRCCRRLLAAVDEG